MAMIETIPKVALSQPILRFENVRIDAGKGSRARPLAKDISFDLHRGKVLGLIGESGAGKSTIGLAALGFTRPGCHISDGRIIFDNACLRTGMSASAVRKLRSTRIAYVAQSAAASFNPAFRLLDQCVEMALRRNVVDREEARRRTLDYFARFNIANPEDFGRRYPHQVSGGQLQRAMLAMAMVCQPEIIVFDEPTTALDVTTQIGVLAAIKDALASSDLAAIYISHDLALLSQIADDIVVLQSGGMVEAGPTQQIIHEPRQSYTRNLLEVRKPVTAPVDSGESIPVRLKVSGAVGFYGDFQVLKSVDLTIPAGRSVAIVGESGSGKSTLARGIMGLFPLSSGTIELSGKPVGPLARRDAATLKKIQLIHQYPDTALNPRQTVRTILAKPLKLLTGLRGAALDARIAELLREVELPPELASRYPQALSGGQKQRVCIARALAAEPDMLVCDEVTAALDKLTADEIIGLLGRLKNETGMSTLLITHDFSLVEALADEVVVMKQGEVVEFGPMIQVTKDPQHPYTQRLISSIPTYEEGWIERIRKRYPDAASDTSIMSV
ncbi:ABC transporter ATP-binding protein [Agrobacterium vitis]